MNYDEIIGILLDRFPELQQRYDEDKDYLEDLPHLLFEIIFVPYIREILKSENDTHRKHEPFELIEIMVNCLDEKVQELAAVSILKPLVSEREIVPEIKRYLGPKSSKAFNEMEKTFGWTN